MDPYNHSPPASNAHSSRAALAPGGEYINPPNVVHYFSRHQAGFSCSYKRARGRYYVLCFSVLSKMYGLCRGCPLLFRNRRDTSKCPFCCPPSAKIKEISLKVSRSSSSQIARRNAKCLDSPSCSSKEAVRKGMSFAFVAIKSRYRNTYAWWNPVLFCL